MKRIFFICTGLLFALGVAPHEKLPVNKNKPEGKIVFSNQQFDTSPASAGKTSFTSAEYIYGRMELSGATIKQAFKLREPDKSTPFPCLMYDLTVLKDGNVKGSSINNFLLLKNGDEDKTVLNFDILPDPAKWNSLFSILKDFDGGYGYVPMYGEINYQLYFHSAGMYQIKIKIYYRSSDAWGKEEATEKWPQLEESFDFNLNETDVPRLKKNGETLFVTIKENAFRYDKLPDVFSNPAVISDPKVTPAKVNAILKRDLSNRTIIKWIFKKYDGPLWYVAKDDYNLPKYRYFNPYIYVAYKMDGKCYIGNVTLRENYEGGGKYGPLEVGFTSAGNRPDNGIDCNMIK